MSIKRQKKVAMVVMAVVSAISVIVGYHYFRSEYQRSERARCKARMNHIGLSIRIYGDENDRAHPPSFRSLVESVPSMGASNFVCPASGSKGGVMEHVDEWTDFVLTTNRMDLAAERKITCYCRPSNHGSKGCGVLYSDGTVDWTTKEELNEHISQGWSGIAIR